MTTTVTATVTANATLDKIVVPLDGSELSDRILRHVRRILVRKDAQVTLLRVIPEHARDRLAGDEVDTALVHLDRLVTALRAEGANVRSELLVGPPAERIASFAETSGASLIAMATHGRTGLARWLRGSTAESVLRAARAPVLLANPFALTGKDEIRLRRILVALDFSARSREILPLVRELALLYGSRVTLLHVVELPVPLEYPATFERVSGADAEKLLAEAARTLEGIDTTTVTEIGSPASAILERATRDEADLIAMTTHGRSGAARLAFGSVAEHVVRHAGCPLLVKRSV